MNQAREGKLDPSVVDAILSIDVPGDPEPPWPVVPMSSREIEVLRLLVRGLTNRQIAATLFLSTKTVGHHVESIYNKAGVSTRVGATLYAVQHGLMK